MRKKDEENSFTMGITESWKTMYRNKTDMLLWLVFNVVLGAIPVWFVFLIFMIATPAGTNPYDPILKGDLLIFITGLCAASISIIWEIKGEHYWNSRRVLVSILLLLIFLSSSLYSLLSFPTVKSVMGFDDQAVIRTSLIIGFAATVVCIHMFAMRFSMKDIEDFAQEESDKRKKFIEKAKESTQTKSGEKV
jgi:hypothetical protein